MTQTCAISKPQKAPAVTDCNATKYRVREQSGFTITTWKKARNTEGDFKAG